MSRVETFDDFEQGNYTGQYGEMKPFAFRDEQDEKGTLSWLMANFNTMEQMAQSRIEVYRRYLYFYKGIYFRDSSRLTDGTIDTERGMRKPRQAVNFVNEKVEARTAQASRNKIAIATIPANDESEDVNNAKACKMLLDSRADELGLDRLHTDMDRWTYLFGTSFMYVKWNPNLGDVSPDWKMLQEKGMVEEGSQEVKVGDVEVEVIGPDKVFPELGRKKWEQVDHVDIIEYVTTEELKADYPEVADIISSGRRRDFGYGLGEWTYDPKYTQIRHFYHRPTKYLPKGVYIKYCDDAILETSDYPFKHGKLPLVMDTDIDVYDELWGRSFVSKIENLTKFYNGIQSAIVRDITVGSSPKWVMPKGSAKVTSLNNDFGVIEYTGAIAPQIIAGNPISKDSIVIQDRIESKINNMSSTYDISQGETPKGVTANSALRFLDEQESQRLQVSIQKRNRRVVEVYKMMMSVMGQFYSPNDGRILRILGKKNEYMIEDLSHADFTKVSDIKIQNTSALPDTKTGKIAAIIDLNATTQNDPIFKKEEIISMLDMGMDEAFRSEATYAVDTTRMIIDSLLQGKPVPQPEITDNLLVAYAMIRRTLQSPQYKLKTKPEIKKSFEEYIITMEYLMYVQSMKNIKFLQTVMEFESYPMFFQLPQPLAMMAQKAMAPVMPTATPDNGNVETNKMPNTSKQIKTEQDIEGEDKANMT